MTNRSSRAQIARDTLEILERGHYTAPNGNEVSISEWLRCACEGSVLYAPDMFADVFQRRDELPRGTTSPHFEVVNQTTLSVARRRVEHAPNQPLLCLNFASAKNAGNPANISTTTAQGENWTSSTP